MSYEFESEQTKIKKVKGEFSMLENGIDGSQFLHLDCPDNKRVIPLTDYSVLISIHSTLQGE